MPDRRDGARLWDWMTTIAASQHIHADDPWERV